MLKKRCGISVFLRILIPLLIMVWLQVTLLYGMLQGQGVFDTLNESALRLLEESAANKQQVLLTSMVNDWSNLSDTEKEIDEIVEDVLRSNGAEWDDIRTDAGLNAQIMLRCTDTLIERLRRSKTTGIYMVLNGIGVENKPETRAGVYIRDDDPYSTPTDNSDLLLLRGLPRVSREKNLSLHSYWASAFRFEGGSTDSNNAFFYRPLTMAMKSDSNVSSYFGYWSPAYNNNGERTDREVITYSLPLINREGVVYGVLGVDVNLSLVNRIISNTLTNGRSDCFYYLGIEVDDSLDFRKVTASGDRFNLGSFTAERDTVSEDGRFLVTKAPGGQTLWCASVHLNLYNDNTPFVREHWVLMAVQDEESLFATAMNVRRLILLSLGITLVVGVVVVLHASMGVVRPIRRLVSAVRAGGQTLPHSGARELDELAEAFDLRNREILRSAARTAELITMSGLKAGVFEINSEINKVYYSKGLLTLLGVREGEVPLTAAQLQSLLAKACENHEADDIYVLTQDGEKRYIRVVEHRDEEDIIGAVLDITKDVLEHRRVLYERDYDALTGIWGRRAFEKEMDRLFMENRDELGSGAVVMLDLDNLKYINDAYGHDSGDAYIRAFAAALQEGASPRTLVARRSGDEFYLFIHGCASREEARAEVKHIWETVTQKTLTLPDRSAFRLRASGGVAWYPEDAQTPARLIHYADFAMYQVKHAEKGSIESFDARQYQENSFLINGQNALNRLIDQQLIRFVFQPIIAVADGSVYGYELLMRSHVEQLGTPDLILKMARSQNRLHAIEKMVWNRALQSVQEMLAQGRLHEDAHLFINSIASQVMTAEELAELNATYKEELRHVVVEVTEAETNNMEYTNTKVANARLTGGLVAIDDYGTGYNSELSLIRIPADIVKIDMSLVRGVDADPDKQQLIRNLIAYARERHIAVLAEGVENAEEMRVLVGFGVDYLQGYFLGRPDYTPAVAMPPQAREALKALRARPVDHE